MACDTLLTYLYFNEKIKIHTDAINLKSGAVISQKIKPMDFYSRKINDDQKRYIVTEKELPRIFDNLKEFRTILLGQKLIIYTDHENITFKNFNTDRVFRWRLIIKEYGPNIEYTKGKKNILSDALSIFSLNGNQETIHNSTYKK